MFWIIRQDHDPEVGLVPDSGVSETLRFFRELSNKHGLQLTVYFLFHA
jgi:hypothetical protein